MKTIHDFGYRKSEEKQKRNHTQTAQGLETVLRHLLKFHPNSHLTFEQLTPERLLAFKSYLIEQGCCRNTCANYLIRLQAIHRQAAHEGITAWPNNLYGCVLTDKTEVSTQRAISIKELKQIWNADLSHTPTRLCRARDILILSFCLRGIPFVDLAKLRKTDIKQGVLRYCRSKTGKAVCIKLLPCALEIIERWRDQEMHFPLLFSFIKYSGEAEQDKRYNSAQRLYNKHLTELVTVLGLDHLKLSSYTSRHTWATLAHEAGIDVAYISEALSHSDIRTTQHYLAAASVDKLSQINEQVIEIVRPKVPKENKKKQLKKED